MSQIFTHAMAKFNLRSPELALARSKRVEVVGEEMELFF